LTALATGMTVGANCGFASGPISRPDYVAPGCASPANSKACRVAVRYLAALDLDRFAVACSLLEPETLKAAGGMAGCKKTLAAARGIRIHYSVLQVHHSPLGRTVYFSTRVEGRSAIHQAMIVTPRGRILAVIPTP
jgi:hypothetical protein